MPTKAKKVSKNKKSKKVVISTPSDDTPVVQESNDVNTEIVDNSPNELHSLSDNDSNDNDNDSNDNHSIDNDSIDNDSIDNDSIDNDSADNKLDIVEQVQFLITVVSGFKKELRGYEIQLKELHKGCKAALKGNKKKTKLSDEKKKKHGVMKLYDVPDIVTDFLSKAFTKEFYDNKEIPEDERKIFESGTQVSRKDLLTGVNAYIRSNKLSSGKTIQRDDNLKSILCKYKSKVTKQYENLDNDTLVFTQIMGALTYWLDQNIDHSVSEASTV